MTPDRWQLIKDLFTSALDREEPERSTWLDEQCRDDEALRAEVDSLISAHSAPEGTLDTPAKDHAGLAKLSLVDVLKEQQALVTLRRRALDSRDDE